MPVYQRMTMVNAVQFFEDNFKKNSLDYPEVWDRAMFNENWFDKTANDGRYYVINQPNTYIDQNEYATVNNGDYIIREDGIVHILPKEIFERHFEKISD